MKYGGFVWKLIIDKKRLNILPDYIKLTVSINSIGAKGMNSYIRFKDKDFNRIPLCEVQKKNEYIF